jgi:DNA-binding response OmpR family regulator
MQHHILIIEDDTAVAHSLQDGLQQAGYATTWHNRGAAGISFARNQHPHLILLDVRLPDGSGFDFCRQMRQLKLRQPIIMLTVQGEEMDKVLGLEMGADDYLTKPYSLRELLSRIRAHLRRAYGELSASDAEHLFVRDLVIDLGRGKVERGPESINLTPTEFRLLVHLARHPGQALSRSQLLQAVWEDEMGIESDRTVNVHIRRLREKIELIPSQPSLILTVPGIGYRLVAE